MRFGFMDHLPCATWQSEGQRYHDILAQIELGDKVGFDTAWLAEILPELRRDEERLDDGDSPQMASSQHA